MRIERNEEQIGKIDDFCREYNKIKEWDRQGCTLVAGMFAFIHVMCTAVLYELLMERNYFLLYGVLVSGIMATTWYITPFRSFKENEKMHRFPERLKYLPVDAKTWKLWCMEKMFSYVKKMFLVSLAMTVVVGLLSHCLSVRGILCTVAVSFFAPLLVGALDIFLGR